MASLITQVKSRLFIHSSQKSAHPLDGSYASLTHGRSHDFEDLRQYEYGDLVKDIDWRATARQGTPLVKRFRAYRMHTVMFAVDTGLSMSALAAGDYLKRELAILTVGALGYLTLRHGDDVTLVYGDTSRVRRRAPTRSEGGLEMALRTVNTAIENTTSAGSVDALLTYIVRNIARRMIVVVVTDEAPISAETERLLRRVRVQHDIVWVTIEDADPVVASPKRATSRRARADVESRWHVPDFVQGDRTILEAIQREHDDQRAHRASVLESLEISHVNVDSPDTAIPALLRMLNRRSRARG